MQPQAYPPNNQSAKPQNKKGCLAASAIGGCIALLAICAVVVVLFFVIDPFGEEGFSGSTPGGYDGGYDSESYADDDGFESLASEEDYSLQRIRGPETTPESVEGFSGYEATQFTLSDGSRLDLPASTAPVDVSFSRETTTIQFNEQGLETSGSTRVLAFNLAQIDSSFIPQLTIPASEMGELHPATVNILRVGPLWVNGEVLPDQVSYLPLTFDQNGDISFIDTDIAALAIAQTSWQPAGNGKMAALAGQYGDGRNVEVRYVPMTFQTHLEWYMFPRLVRMIVDPDVPGYRRPAEANRDRAVLQKPVNNVITLVHGHNEEEKDGSAPPSAGEPWLFAYKQDVWDEFYKTFVETRSDQLECTAFYEFIYPTYRPAYSPIAGGVVEPLGTTFAKAMNVGARNDGYLLKRMREAEKPVNVFIAAHSMGGLVARAGVRNFDEYMQASFQRLVTWGTPHHGSPLVSLGYLFRGAYTVNPGKLRDAHWAVPEGDINVILGSDMLEWLLDRKLQLDTPGTRDLRWDNMRPLRLDEIFSSDTKAIMLWDPLNTQYSLVNGSWLYNDNLRIFNESDPYYNTDKYYFLYGTTSKRLPNQKGDTAMGATIMPSLLKDANRTISDGTGERLEGESDGAVPLFSMAGIGIATNRYNLGDLDHEEYYSSAGERGRKTARATFTAFGLDDPRCTCSRVVIENRAALNADTAYGVREVNARFYALPGEEIDRAYVIIFTNGDPNAEPSYNEETGIASAYNIGELSVTNNSLLNGSFILPYEVEGETLLVVRVYLWDGSEIDSDPVPLHWYPSDELEYYVDPRVPEGDDWDSP